MNVLVIGAAGKSGEQVVKAAQAAGHTVTAFVRDAGAYAAPAGVRVVSGDATDPAAVGPAVQGQDAVVDAIGGKTPYKHTDLERDTAKAVLAAMKQAGVRRFVAISVIGVGDSKDQTGWVYEHLLMPTFLRGAVPDKAAMEQAVRDAGVDFVLVRPPFLTDGEPTGHVHVFTGDETAHKITRADLGRFIVDQLSSDEYVGRAVTVANR